MVGYVVDLEGSVADAVGVAPGDGIVYRVSRVDGWVGEKLGEMFTR